MTLVRQTEINAAKLNSLFLVAKSRPLPSLNSYFTLKTNFKKLKIVILKCASKATAINEGWYIVAGKYSS